MAIRSWTAVDTVTKYLADEKNHSAFKSKMFKRLNHVTGQISEVEFVEWEIENREPIIVGFFILQYAIENVRTLL